MGYPVEMIGINTKLFSVIGDSAIEHKQDTFFNHFFQENEVDCKMMPLNIREDDLGFFLNGLKDSKIDAVYFEAAYWENVHNLLDIKSDEVIFCGICDTLDIKNNQYITSLTQGRAVVQLIQETHTIRSEEVLLIGATSSAKSVLYNLVKESPSKIILAAEIIEDLLEMIKIIPETIPYDIIRIQDNSITYTTNITINFLNRSIQTNTLIDFNTDFNKILTKIAQIKTKEWSNNG